MNNNENKKIYTTKDYSIFKELPGNRQDALKRAKGIIKSIEEIGYITNPIIVNEDMQVVDGQGRLEALRQLGMPVDYVICPRHGN